MQVCTRFGSWRPPCIFQNLFIIIILMQMIISQTKDFAQTNGYLSNKRRAQSRRGDIAAATVARSNTSLKRRDEGRYKPSKAGDQWSPLQRWFVVRKIIRSSNDSCNIINMNKILNIQGGHPDQNFVHFPIFVHRTQKRDRRETAVPLLFLCSLRRDKYPSSPDKSFRQSQSQPRPELLSHT